MENKAQKKLSELTREDLNYAELLQNDNMRFPSDDLAVRIDELLPGYRSELQAFISAREDIDDATIVSWMKGLPGMARVNAWCLLFDSLACKKSAADLAHAKRLHGLLVSLVLDAFGVTAGPAGINEPPRGVRVTGTR